MKKKMYRILALICVCAMMVCSFSFAADVTPRTVNSVSYGCSSGHYNSSAYTESDAPGDIGASFYGWAYTAADGEIDVGGSMSTWNASASCYEDYSYSLQGEVWSSHSYNGNSYSDYDSHGNP